MCARARVVSVEMVYNLSHLPCAPYLGDVIKVVIITIGSAKAKRKKGAYAKFKTLFLWFVIALVLIFAAVPWPFSPLAQRPFLRSF